MLVNSRLALHVLSAEGFYAYQQYTTANAGNTLFDYGDDFNN